MFKRLPACLAAIFGNSNFVLALIVIYPLLFIWQGLDFTDTGYIITNYQQIFAEPSSIEATYRIWLTNILGGVWVYFLGDLLGLTGIRFAAVLLNYATLYLSYLTLKPFFRRIHLLWGLFLAVVFINRSGIWFNYNTFTAFFYVLGAFLLTGGLLKRRPWIISLAGFILGLNIFVRLPNILGFALILAVFFYGFTKKIPIKEQMQPAVFFILGYLTSIVAVLAVMYLLGHLNAYIDAFRGTFTMLKDPGGHHRSNKLVDAFLRHHKDMLGKLLTIGFRAAVFTGLLSITASLRKNLLQYIIISAAALYLLYKNLAAIADSDWVNMLIITVGLLYAFLVALLLTGGRAKSEPGDGRDREGIRLISFISLMILVIAPLGSNVAIRNSIYGMYLALPLVFSFIAGITEVSIVGKSPDSGTKGPFYIGLGKGETALIKALAVTIFLFVTIQSAYFFTYRDAYDRMSMTYTVNHPALKGTFTTRERAAVVNELLEELPKYVNEGDYLLTYEQVSMVHFLTKTRPYLYSAWPMLYSPQVFEASIKRALRERPYLPVIVRAKRSTENFYWPEKGLTARETELLQSTYHKENRALMEKFIRRYNYKLAWENDFFEILAPEKRTK